MHSWSGLKAGTAPSSFGGTDAGSIGAEDPALGGRMRSSGRSTSIDGVRRSLTTHEQLAVLEALPLYLRWRRRRYGSGMRLAVLTFLVVSAGCADGAEPRLSPLPMAVVPLERCFAVARAGGEPPARLSETGCFEQLDPLEPSAELVPYAVAAPLFTDGAEKARWLGLPDGASVQIDSDGAWSFPVGALLVKHFALMPFGAEALRPMETRFMLLDASGWRFYTYRWDEEDDARLLEDQEHAVLQVEDPERPDEGQEIDYLYPSRAGCQACHTGGHIGPSTAQLDIEVRYGDAGPVSQLDALRGIGALDGAPPLGVAPLPSPADVEAPLEVRARAYLHANCSHCHRPGGFASSAIDLDLRWETPLDDTRMICVETQYPSVAGYGLRVAPGDPDASVIVQRMEAGPTDFPSMMPPLGRSTVDREEVAIVRAWIASLTTPCP